ncbi:putative protein kinase RLK-Pelle-L-LEC family [Helianthus annuus]|uniref:Protein kinase domain-containing protein n=1 Tax=Helianthus annuus TaxID=4232 RepID=A0A9K3HXS9_HELAN|nr:putative protein kinase RLK-Pelle-L-LEC family [Helianthus annuus]KAJ0513842.1 putative protein kinase RLK-Pelle-L-LEC family [Helianthus annuus]KAJ0521795.1 putative protein kinase RLK-Pelle-L-LEC family [Helianthus annuus]KAJ0529952.1 putative protein kinase RLK-Pelle-L-LEC family [Helianthus annuus]KAJ0696818.1 putative protein kinase RLK-Pelle-L-LEC family [Helianthus annuus]
MILTNRYLCLPNGTILLHSLEHLKIPLSVIQLATDDFSKECIVGSWDHYTLYKAELKHYDKENHSSKRQNTALIKRYPSGNENYGEKEFLTEIETLSNVKHPNIVTLLGYCIEAFERILVIDNFSNGYLYRYLQNLNNRRSFTWEKRLNVCIDVAHALSYLHFEMENQKMIINRDIWSFNIGLDENLGAKIVDFWWSIFMLPNQEDKGPYEFQEIYRPSHIDLEYKKTGKVKRASDVYSFGVVLFEILCGRVARDPIYLKESEKGLAPVARRSFNTGTLEDMIDPILREETGENNFVLNRGLNKESLHTFIKIAHQCVAETQDKCPTMKVVVNELEKAFFFHVSHCFNFILSLRIIHICVLTTVNIKYKGSMHDNVRFKKKIMHKQLGLHC